MVQRFRPLPAEPGLEGLGRISSTPLTPQLGEVGVNDLGGRGSTLPWLRGPQGAQGLGVQPEPFRDGDGDPGAAARVPQRGGTP